MSLHVPLSFLKKEKVVVLSSFLLQERKCYYINNELLLFLTYIMTLFKTMYSSAFTKSMSQISQLPVQGFA